jgi:hypothetical protein
MCRCFLVSRSRNGVFVQDFVPGVDTTKTRRQLGGFDPPSFYPEHALARAKGINDLGPKRCSRAREEPRLAAVGGLGKHESKTKRPTNVLGRTRRHSFKRKPRPSW